MFFEIENELQATYGHISVIKLPFDVPDNIDFCNHTLLRPEIHRGNLNGVVHRGGHD